MIVYGIANQWKYLGDGTLQIQVRIPSIHGPASKSEYKGKQVRNYVEDANLPYYPSLLLPHLPAKGAIVALSSINDTPNSFIVIGLTGGSTSYVAANSGG